MLNTILRTSLFAPVYVPTQCATKKDIEQLPLPSVTFGFPSRAWHADALHTAVPPVAALKMNMGEPDQSASLSPNTILPMTTAIASNLVISGIHVALGLNLHDVEPFELRVNRYFGDPIPPRVAETYNFSMSSELPTLSITRTFLYESNALW